MTITLDTGETVEGVQDVSTPEDAETCNRLFYELNDNHGKVWLGVYKEIKDLQGNRDFRKWHEENKGDIMDHYKYHRFKFI